MANKIERRVWVWDRANRAPEDGDLPISPLLNYRYHIEGWCVAVQPYGTTVGATTSYEGDPNDFSCPHCGNDYRRLTVSSEEARKLTRVTEKAKNGLDNLDAFATSSATYGCYCVTGYEHAARRCEPAPPQGLVSDSKLVPMVCKTVDMTPEDEGGDVEEVPVETDVSESPHTQEPAVALEAPDSSPSGFQNPFA